MNSVMVLLPDGFDDVIRRMLIEAGRTPPEVMTDAWRTTLIRIILYKIFDSIDGEYAAAYRELNQPRA